MRKLSDIPIERSPATRQGETNLHLLTSEPLLTYNANLGFIIRAVMNQMNTPQIIFQSFFTSLLPRSLILIHVKVLTALVLAEKVKITVGCWYDDQSQ